MDISRRSFFGGLGAIFAISAGGCTSLARCGKVRLAVVGAWGKGYTDWTQLYKTGLVEIAAFCDCDRNVMPKVADELKRQNIDFDLAHVPFFTDYRRLLDNAGLLALDAVLVSTPDHVHGAIAITAMKLGLHVYVQKPLVRTLWELDYFRRTAIENGVITQMGNQGSSGANFRRGVEVLKSGILGKVSEIHIWTNRPVWPQGDWARDLLKTPDEAAPAGLDWEAWIGTAAMRPYKGERGVDPRDYPWCVKVGNTKVYHQFNWRGFSDFGAGALGDMASHLMNLPYRGLGLGAMAWANCKEVRELYTGIYPRSSIVEIGFAAHPDLKMTWYEGGFLPPADLTSPILSVEEKLPVGGVVIVGEKGTFYSTDNYGQTTYLQLKGEKKPTSILTHEACKDIPVTLARCPEERTNGNYGEFVRAIRGEGTVFKETHSRCYGDIEHSIPLMEGMLAACAAQNVPGRLLKWDSAAQSFDCAEANALVRPYVRRGWEF
jgi:hypothetical protein